MRPLILIAAVLILTGCSSTTAEPTAEPTPAPTTDTACLTVTDGVSAALQGGIIPGYQVATITAIEDDGAWWVAATLDGEPEVTGVWYTQQDPSTADDAAFLSATKLASLTSTYVMPDDLTGSAAVKQATDCL